VSGTIEASDIVKVGRLFKQTAEPFESTILLQQYSETFSRNEYRTTETQVKLYDSIVKDLAKLSALAPFNR
jgi:hypothetical protein